MSLRLRLALFGAGVVALALVVFGLLLYALLSRGVITNQDDALRIRAQGAAASLQGLPPPSAPVAPVDLDKSDEVFLELLRADGTVLYATGLLNGQPPAASRSLLDSATSHRGAFATQGSLRMYAFPYLDSGYIVTGQSTRVPQSSLSGIVAFLVISAIPALLAALIASWLVAGRALAPLQSVAIAAEDIGRNRDFGRRLPVPASRDQVALFASSFNGMLDRLQEAYESQRRFVADASHELRTPLTTIQGNAGLLAFRAVSDATRQEAAGDVIAETGRMTRLVDRLLTLARADSGLQLELRPTDLKALTEEVCRQASQGHPAVRLELEAGAAAVNADEDELRQLVWILLDNAFRYARAQVLVRVFVEGDWARLLVADDGPGIPPPQRERVFERFYRADASRPGVHAGLGLSIARWIAGQHAGRIVAGEAVLGGAAFLVDLPLLRSS
jgi:two-component system, OmpR family, sensor kinase